MTTKLQADVAVLGAGCGGSLIALLLNRIGRRVVLLDRGSHPRFAIGESSTPIADLVLRDLARRYDLPAIAPLACYGTWKEAYPSLTCGLKRGFSYFRHRPNEPFLATDNHRHELLVAASREDAVGDTHWLRSDVDTFFAQQVADAGIPYFDRMEVTVEANSPQWQLAGNRSAAACTVQAEFVVDATGSAGFLPRRLAVADCGRQLGTNSRALFAHFTGVRHWQKTLDDQRADTSCYPFPCDAAAVHHVLDEGWMWQLRFDNGVTSAGLVIDADRHPLDAAIRPEAEWARLLARYPSLDEQFEAARICAPAGGLVRTGRLQRQWRQVSGANWALLPHTAGFVDPFYSAGLAHTLCGVERLAHVLEHHWGRESLGGQLAEYQRTVRSELSLVDELIHGSYRAMRNFDLLIPFSMVYFAASIWYEHHRLETGFVPQRSFLGAEDPALRRLVSQIRRRLDAALRHAEQGDASKQFFAEVAQAIAPYNLAGLCDARVNNMYRYTAVDTS